MICANARIEDLVSAGTKRLLERATNARSLDAAALYGRVSAVLNKYLLPDQPASTRATVDQFLDALHADDLCLVVACEHGDEGAWCDLMTGYGATVLQEARRLTRREDTADELAGSIWAELYGLRGDEAGRVSGKLAYYSGLGSLGGWLRAVVRQMFVNNYRQHIRLTQLSEETDLNSQMSGGGRIEDGPRQVCFENPERSLQSRQVNTHIHAALSKAIQTLDSEDRLLLALYHFDDLCMEEVGKVLGVHQATISRRLTKLHLQLRRHLKGILRRDYGWTANETDTNVGEGIFIDRVAKESLEFAYSVYSRPQGKFATPNFHTN